MLNRSSTQIGTQAQGTYAQLGSAVFGGGMPKLQSPALPPAFQPQLRTGAMQTIYSPLAPAEARKANAEAMQAKIAAAKTALNNAGKAASGKATSLANSATAGTEASRTQGEMWFRQQSKTQMEYVAFDRFVNFGDEPDERI